MTTFFSFAPLKKILITGAKSPAALEWIRRLGPYYTVYMADSMRFPLSKGSRFVTDYWHHPSASRTPSAFAAFLARQIEAHQVDLVIPTCEETFYLARFQDQLPCPIFCPPFELLQRVHSKIDIMTIAQDCGISLPTTRRLRAIEEKEKIAANYGDLVFKPEYSRFASDVLIRPSLSDFEAITPTVDRPWAVQDYVQGKEFCSYSIAVNGALTAHACYHPLYRAGKGAGMYFEPVNHLAIFEFATRFAAKTNWTGQLAFDLMETRDGQIFVLECNPRATSGIHLLPDDQVGDRLFSTIPPLNTQPDLLPKMSAAAMILYGGKYMKNPMTFIKDMQCAKDIIWSSKDKKPFFYQFIALGEIIVNSLKTGQSLIRTATEDGEWNGQSLSNDVRLFSAAELSQIVWPEDGYAQRYLTPFLLHGSTPFIQNVSTVVKVLQVGEHVLPVTINGPVYGQSYVCSIHTAFILYAREEIARWQKKSPKNPSISLTSVFLKGAVKGLEWMINAAQIDQIVSVNNWMLSTNLYPAWSGEHLAEITQRLRQNYPNHTLVFRSLNEVTSSVLMSSFEAQGYLLVPARQVYFVHQCFQDFMKKRDTKEDLKLLAKTPYRVVEHADITPDDYERISHLYNLLYLEKYSAYNPQFTPLYIRLCHEQNLLTMMGLRNKNGVLDGIIGFFERNGVFTTPLVGYETALPLSVGLYRLLTILVLRHANTTGLIFNMSSGAAHFKRLRGAVPIIEYSAVYVAHLPWPRRFLWQLLGSLLRRLAVPIMEKYKL